MEQIYERTTLIGAALTRRIIGCAIKVHKTLGPGYDESYYQKALIHELVSAGLTVRREVEFKVFYGDLYLGTKRIDLVVEDCVVELKAKSGLESIDAAQVVSYLKASGCTVGLLINFGCVKVQAKRFVSSRGSVPELNASYVSTPPRIPRLRDSESKE